MSETFDAVRELVSAGRFRLSQHGEEEMNEDGLLLSEILQSLASAIVVEDYPTAWKGPTVLLLHECEGRRFHAIWGLSKTSSDVATLVTAYLPDPDKWHADLRTRLKQ